MSGFQFKLLDHWPTKAVGSTITLVLGWFFWLSPLGQFLEAWSYDVLTVAQPVISHTNVIILALDTTSKLRLNQTDGIWDRSIHARVIERLTADGARLVVCDLFLRDRGPSLAADQQLAKAIKNNGNVVLVARLEAGKDSRFVGSSPLLPQAEFLEVAAGWGVDNLWPDHALNCGDLQNPSLAWSAAALVNPEVTSDPNQRLLDRWLRYYGPPGSVFWSIPYWEATNQITGYYSNKIVFIGSYPQARLPGEKESDAISTPFTRFSGAVAPGVEIHATAFLNLINRDWLVRLPAKLELLVILLVAMLFGYGLSMVRPFAACALAFLGVLIVSFLAIFLVWRANCWFPWLIAAGVQIPLALCWSIISHAQRRNHKAQEVVKTVAMPPKKPEHESPPPIPDHTMVKCIGKGGYGVVWLARDAIGTYHAVKVIRRHNFPSDSAFEREFRGIQKFTPISRSHPGFVHILHVGRNESEGYFYCIMELADDESSGQTIDPSRYLPKSLSREIFRWKRIPADQCLQYGLLLTSALNHMHAQGLVHRDIKPSNIIFVNAMPKFADIGLVTHMVPQGREVTYIGTEGYIPPEGPGTAQADIRNGPQNSDSDLS